MNDLVWCTLLPLAVGLVVGFIAGAVIRWERFQRRQP